MDLVGLGPWPVAIILFTIAVGALIKGVTGLGLPIFAVPALAVFVSIETAVIVMALPSLVANTWLVILHRAKLPLLAAHRTFLIPGFIGAVVGTWLLAAIDDTVLRTVLAAWLGFYLVQHYLGGHTSSAFAGKGGLAGPLGLAAGSLQGATGISAPVIGPYYHAHGLSLSAYAFAVAFTFALLSVGQLSTMTTVQMFTPTLLLYSVMATLTTIIFMPIGVRLARYLKKEAFDRLLPVLFMLIEVKLLYDILS